MKKSRMKRIRETIKNAVVVLILAIITVVLLEIPRQYYSWQDEKLVNRITVKDYSVITVNEPMNLYQKISALVEDESIVAECKKIILSEDEKTKISKSLLSEIETMLFNDSYWISNLNSIIMSEEIHKECLAFQIIRVVDGKIYSFDLGILTIRDNVFYNFDEGNINDVSGEILFDMDSGKILDINVNIYSEMFDSYNTTIVEDYSEKNAQERKILLIESLEIYYGIDIGYDESCSYADIYSLRACPFTKEILNGKTMKAVYNYIN